MPYPVKAHILRLPSLLVVLHHADCSCALQLAANLGEVTQDRDELQACKAALEAEVRQLQADLRSWQGRCSTSEDSCAKLRGDLGQAQAAQAQLKVPCSL